MMNDKNLRNIYPISWISESPSFVEFIQKWNLDRENDLLVADFASGEYDRVPTFFTKELPRIVDSSNETEKRIIVFCTDLHPLRLDSLLGKLEEDQLLDTVRVVHSTLEKLDSEANLRASNFDYFDEHPDTMIWLDDFLIGEQRFPSECIDIGILNNDVIGYLYEYYKEYSNATMGLRKVYSLIRSGGLLLVTMPCLQYKIDNISVLENIGFSFIEGFDITLSIGKKTSLGKNVPLDELSNLGHYTFLIFSKP
jgi:hypothetical protein